MVSVSSRARDRSEVGAVAIIVAISATLLFVLAALVVDLGLARDTRRESQNAADAAALAAVNVLYPSTGKCTDGTATPATGCKSDAASAAKTYAEKNFKISAADWATCSTPPTGFSKVGTYPQCISIDGVGKHVWVVMPHHEVKFGFGTVTGASSAEIGSAARAVVAAGGVSNCGLCLLGTGSHVIQNGDVTVNGTSVQTNGSLSTQQNNGHVTVTGGTVSVQNTANGNILPTPVNTGAGTLADPLAGIALPEPSNSWMNVPAGTKTNICTQGPGFYNSPTIANNCTLTTGIYIITGTLGLAGQKSINATAGVTLYFACGTASSPRKCLPGASNLGEAGGSMTFAGQATLSIHPPASGLTKGLSIVSDRWNNSELELRGNGGSTVSGTIYAASGSLGFRGNGTGSMDSLVVVKDLTFKGNPSTMSLIYTANNNVSLPPTPGGLDR